MKILHVTWDLGEGGAQIYLLGLLNELQKFPDLEIRVLVLHDRGALSKLVEKSCDHVTHLAMRSGWDIFGVFRLIGYLISTKVDLVHFHFPNVAFHLFMQFLKVPVVYTEHGGGLLAGSLSDKMLYRLFYRPIRCFIAISDYMARSMANENSRLLDRIEIIYNGVSIANIDHEQAVCKSSISGLGAKQNYIVGFVGRLVYQKGLEYFIETAKEILRQRNDVMFLIIGSGPDEEKLRLLAEELGILDHILFLGYRMGAVRYMKLFDVMLFTSRFEPFGLVLTEAMAARVPVVAMDIRGAVSEIIRPDIDGIVVQGGDCLQASKSVCRLLDDREFHDRTVNSARERVATKFTLRHNARKVYDLYQKLGLQM